MPGATRIRLLQLDLTPYELAAFAGLEPAADLLRRFQPATPHPTGMTDIWFAAASRLPESAALGGSSGFGEQGEREFNLEAGHASHDGGWPRRPFSGRRSIIEVGRRSQSRDIHSPCELRLALRASGSRTAVPGAIRMGSEFARLRRSDGASQSGLPWLRHGCSSTPAVQRRSICQRLIGDDTG